MVCSSCLPAEPTAAAPSILSCRPVSCNVGRSTSQPEPRMAADVGPEPQGDVQEALQPQPSLASQSTPQQHLRTLWRDCPTALTTLLSHQGPEYASLQRRLQALAGGTDATASMLVDACAGLCQCCSPAASTGAALPNGCCCCMLALSGCRKPCYGTIKQCTCSERHAARHSW